MLRKQVIGLILSAGVISACTSDAPVTIPGEISGGYSGNESTLGGNGFGDANTSAGGTLPGSQVSDRVLFEVNQTSLSPDAIQVLNAQVGWLRANPGAPVLIEGHADERGTGEYNLALGSGRASAVRNHMVSLGIPDSRISIITYGRERPVATCADNSCYSRNRRAVTVVTGAAGT